MLRGMILVAALVAGCSAVPISKTVAPAEAPQTVSGSGMAESAPVQLAGGDYTIDIKAIPDVAVGCYVGATLRPSDTSVGSATANSLAPVTSTGYAYGLAPGSYHFTVYAGCPWRITVRH